MQLLINQKANDMATSTLDKLSRVHFTKLEKNNELVFFYQREDIFYLYFVKNKIIRVARRINMHVILRKVNSISFTIK